MISKKTRVWQISGEKYTFDLNQFKWLFNTYKDNNGLKVCELEEILSEKLSISTDAIHNWRNSCNGPSDSDTVGILAKFFGVDDNVLLIKVQEDITMNNNYTDYQLDTIKEFYCELLDYITVFAWSECFTDPLASDIMDTDEIMDDIKQKILFANLRNSLQKKYFTLHTFEIYGEFEKMLNDIEADYEEKVLTIEDDDEFLDKVFRLANDLPILWEKRLAEIMTKYVWEKYKPCETGKLTGRKLRAFQNIYECYIDIIDDYENNKVFEKVLRKEKDDLNLVYRKDALDRMLAKEKFELFNHPVLEKLHKLNWILDDLIPDSCDYHNKEKNQKYLLPIRAKAFKELNEIVDEYT